MSDLSSLSTISLFNVRVLVVTFLVNAFAFTLGLSYNNMVESVIDHYVPEKDGKKNKMTYSIRYSVILTIIVIVIVFLLYKIYPNEKK